MTSKLKKKKVKKMPQFFRIVIYLRINCGGIQYLDIRKLHLIKNNDQGLVFIVLPRYIRITLKFYFTKTYIIYRKALYKILVFDF